MTKKKIPTWANFIKCECGCGTRGYKNLTRVPPIMGGVTFDVPLKKTDRFICSPCIKIWHDGGPVNAADLGKEHKRRKKAGEFPFNGEFAPDWRVFEQANGDIVCDDCLIRNASATADSAASPLKSPESPGLNSQEGE
jgi:hypothetical protein